LATKIRLARHGSKKRPYYWIVVADSRSPRDGKFIEKVGVYDPFRPPGEKARIDADVAHRWLDNGAQPTERVSKLFEQCGIGKATKKFNPIKGAPKAKAKQRIANSPMPGPAVRLVELSHDDLEAARRVISQVLAAQ